MYVCVCVYVYHGCHFVKLTPHLCCLVHEDQEEEREEEVLLASVLCAGSRMYACLCVCVCARACVCAVVCAYASVLKPLTVCLYIVP